MICVAACVPSHTVEGGEVENLLEIISNAGFVELMKYSPGLVIDSQTGKNDEVISRVILL
jgi:hypothetical protein